MPPTAPRGTRHRALTGCTAAGDPSAVTPMRRVSLRPGPTVLCAVGWGTVSRPAARCGPQAHERRSLRPVSAHALFKV
jgi:hypothetical protein